MKVSVGQLGGRMYYGVPRILEQANLLDELFTDFVGTKPPLSFFAKNTYFKRMISKRLPDIPHDKIVQDIYSSFYHLYQTNLLKISGLEVHKEFLRQGQSLENKIIKHGLDTDAVFMIGSSSSKVFKAAKDKGIITIKEQSGAPADFVYEIMKSEWESFSEWEDCYNDIESYKFWIDNASNEDKLSDLIICPSDYVQKAILSKNPKLNCALVPFGIPISEKTNNIKIFEGNRKLRIAYVGRVSLAKGTHYLFEAMNGLHEYCELRIAGNVKFDSKIIKHFSSKIDFLGHIDSIGLDKLYQWADIFIIPSLSEGSATVCYEALSYGLPILASDNSGQFFEHGKEGFYFPIKSTNAIIETIKKYIDNPSLVERQSINAKKLSSYGDFESYAARLLLTLNKNGII